MACLAAVDQFNVSQKWIKIVLVAVFLGGYSLSTGPITWLYNADILPDIGVSLTAALNWVFTGIIGLGFPWVKDNYGIVTAFVIFLITSAIGELYMVFIVIETKGKS